MLVSIKRNSHKIREAGSSGVRRNLIEASPGRPGLVGEGCPRSLLVCRAVEAGGDGGMDGSLPGTDSEPSLPAQSYQPRSSSLHTASIPCSSPGLWPLCLTGGNLFDCEGSRDESILLVPLGGALLPEPSHSARGELGLPLQAGERSQIRFFDQSFPA